MTITRAERILLSAARHMKREADFSAYAVLMQTAIAIAKAQN